MKVSSFLFPEHKAGACAIIAVLGVGATVGGRWFPPDGFWILYLLPVLAGARALRRVEIAAVAAVCAGLVSYFGPLAPGIGAGVLRYLLTFSAYLGIGLFVAEALRRRSGARRFEEELAKAATLRENAERQLHALVEGSPAAILTVHPSGTVLLANAAAHALFKCEPGSLPGQTIDTYLPTLASFRQPTSIRQLVRTMIECAGTRTGGETFLAQVWVSSEGPPSTAGLSLVVFDASEQLREREEISLQNVSLSARVITGAFWHEVRNLCSAIRMVTASLKKRPGVADTEEVEALNSLVNGLEKLASAELHPAMEDTYDVASLRAVLDDLQIVIQPWFEESAVRLGWSTAKNLPLVRGDHHAILQVFLNLARNARRALENAPRKELFVSATAEDHSAVVRFRNTGSPPADAVAMFEAFHHGAAETGIGLHVSRAIMRSFAGDLRFEPSADGCCCFTVVLAAQPLSGIYGDETP